MNDSSVVELERLVEQTVRPVIATRWQKRKMREELMAHLASVFETESQALGDEGMALTRTRQRFGDPAQVAKELGRSVPRWQRSIAYLENINAPIQPNRKSVLQAAMLQSAMMLGLALYWGVFLFVIGWAKEFNNPMQMLIRASLGFAIAPIAYTTIILIAPAYVSDALFGHPMRRAWRQIMAYGLLTAIAIPTFAILILWILTGDFTASLFRARFTLWFVPLGPILFFTFGSRIHLTLQYERHWAAINLDD